MVLSASMATNCHLYVIATVVVYVAIAVLLLYMLLLNIDVLYVVAFFVVAVLRCY